MLKTETVTINGTDYIHTYSDTGYMIERDGVRYSDAIDPVDSGREYEETDEKADVLEAGGEYGDMPTLAEA